MLNKNENPNGFSPIFRNPSPKSPQRADSHGGKAKIKIIKKMPICKTIICFLFITPEALPLLRTLIFTISSRALQREGGKSPFPCLRPLVEEKIPTQQIDRTFQPANYRIVNVSDKMRHMSSIIFIFYQNSQVRQTGFEPATNYSVVNCSIRLSYWRTWETIIMTMKPMSRKKISSRGTKVGARYCSYRANPDYSTPGAQ